MTERKIGILLMIYTRFCDEMGHRGGRVAIVTFIQRNLPQQEYVLILRNINSTGFSIDEYYELY